MAKSGSTHLKIFPERPTEVVRPQVEAVSSLPEMLDAYRQATGWSLQYVAGPEPIRPNELTWSAPVNPGVGASLGHLRLAPAESTSAASACVPIDPQRARTMASATAGMLNELMQTREALWQREAELAAGVPLVPHREGEQHLAARLEAVLRGGARAIDCHAAALYLLDEATTELKLRSSWGLPFDRLTDPPRRLQGAVADLEAMLGHAVVLEDAETMRQWKVPEDFPSVVCVPVCTPTTILGTLWIYSSTKRDFTDRQTNLIEVVAGRLAADLEREMLLREGVDGAAIKRQVDAVERLQRSQLPSISPMLDGWRLSGWTNQAEGVGGDFFDWFCLPDGLLAVCVGDAMDRGLAAAMAANALKAALRAHGQYHRHAEQALKQVNLTLWTSSAGDQFATLFYGLIETATGRVSYSLAGQPGVVVVGPDGWTPLTRRFPPLGESPETDYEPFGYELRPGEAMVLFTDGVRDAADSRGRPLGEAGVAEPLVGRLDLSADQMASLIRETLRARTAAGDRDDQTVLVIRRAKA
ncbi:MAG: hypothetical protein A2V70_12690 [Planctomycetes bacterium RBG_13_63_9]|nr:MAG: hypothetical protein A2V70_12690 [Planctomycetes bacterium RBG_13_63_9]